MKYKVTTIDDVELIYSILRERYPKKEVEITYNYNTKEYFISLTNKPFKNDPNVQVDLNIQVVYGDSIHKMEPVMVRDPLTGYIDIKTISELSNNWKEYPEFKMFDQSVRLEKQYAETSFQIWSDKGWTPIRKVIRHKTDKKIYKVLSHGGCVKVTEDHSLLTEDKEIIKPSKCDTNTLLLTAYPDAFSYSCTDISFEKAYKDGYDLGHNKDRVPIYILNASNEIIKNFLNGFLDANNGSSKDILTDTYFDIKGSIGAAGLYYITTKLGYCVSINTRNDVYRLTLTKDKQRKVNSNFEENKGYDNNLFIRKLHLEIV